MHSVDGFVDRSTIFGKNDMSTDLLSCRQKLCNFLASNLRKFLSQKKKKTKSFNFYFIRLKYLATAAKVSEFGRTAHRNRCSVSIHIQNGNETKAT